MPEDEQTTEAEGGAPTEYELSTRYIVNGPWRPLDTISDDQARAELALWRTIAEYYSPEVRYWLTHLGELLRVFKRDYKPHLGELIMPHFELAKLELGVTERVYDPATAKHFWERKTIIVPANMIANFEFVSERIEAEERDSEAFAEALFEDMNAGANPFERQ